MRRTRPLPTALPASGRPLYLGMWTWLGQRVSSLALIVLLPWHWLDPFSRPVRVAVLCLVVLHAVAGIRVMLMDIGVGERWPRGLVWTLAGGGLVVVLFFLRHA